MSDMPKTLQAAYEAWWEAVRPAGAGEIQTEEMYRAFWCGATCAFWLVVDASRSSEAASLRTLDRLKAELDAFEAHMSALSVKAAERSH